MSEKIDKTEYATSDIHFSAFIMAMDIQLKRTDIEQNGKRKVVFVFDIPKTDLTNLKNDFFGGKGVVKVQKFVQALRSLKSVCFIS